MGVEGLDPLVKSYTDEEICELIAEGRKSEATDYRVLCYVMTKTRGVLDPYRVRKLIADVSS